MVLLYSYSVALQYGMYIPLSKLWHGISNAYVIILLYDVVIPQLVRDALVIIAMYAMV